MRSSGCDRVPNGDSNRLAQCHGLANGGGPGGGLPVGNSYKTFIEARLNHIIELVVSGGETNHVG